MYGSTQLCGFMAYTDAVNPGPEAGTGAGGEICGVGGDPFAAQVVLLMHFNDDVIDATGNHTLSPSGITYENNAPLGSRVSLTSADTINSNATAHLKLVGEFTIEFQVEFVSLAPQMFCWISKGSGGYSDLLCGFAVSTGSANELTFTWMPVGTGYKVGDVTTGHKYHVAVCRNASNRINSWLDGVKSGAYVDDSSSASVNQIIEVATNFYYGATFPIAGIKIDELRITSACRYAEATMGVPSMPFPNP